MSYPHLSPEMVNECSRAAYAYDPACYCAIHWVYADYLPRPQYHGLPTKWLEAFVWRSIGPGQPDRFVAVAVADNGPELLRDLHTALNAITQGEQPDPSLPPPAPPAAPPRVPYIPPAGGGWVGSAPQTTQELNCWPG